MESSEQAFAAVESCRQTLIVLDLLKYENRYAVIHDARWDECMADAIVEREITAIDVSRLIIARFLKIAQFDDMARRVR